MNEVKLFESKEIRTIYYKDEWYFVVNDVVAVVAESINPGEYVKQLRRRDKELGKGWGQIVHPLLVETRGGTQKMNCANKTGVLRIIQSIPSRNAEPFKRWLAETGSQALDERTNKRIAAYRKLKESQKRLYDNAIERGVSPAAFEKILDEGDLSLFDGIDIKKKYQIDADESADAYMNALLLYGKGFATEITNHNTNKDNLNEQNEITQEHKSNNALIRKNLIDKKIIPEALPPEKKLKNTQLDQGNEKEGLEE